MPASPMDIKEMINVCQRLTSAIGTAVTLVFGTAINANGYAYVLDHIWASNTDSVTHVIQLWNGTPSVTGMIGSVAVPAGAGVAGAPSVDLISALFGTNGYLRMRGVDQLSVACEVAITAGAANRVDITITGGYV